MTSVRRRPMASDDLTATSYVPRLLGGHLTYSARDLSEATDTPIERVMQFWIALGFQAPWILTNLAFPKRDLDVWQAGQRSNPVPLTRPPRARSCAAILISRTAGSCGSTSPRRIPLAIGAGRHDGPYVRPGPHARLHRCLPGNVRLPGVASSRPILSRFDRECPARARGAYSRFPSIAVSFRRQEVHDRPPRRSLGTPSSDSSSASRKRAAPPSSKEGGRVATKTTRCGPCHRGRSDDRPACGDNAHRTPQRRR